MPRFGAPLVACSLAILLSGCLSSGYAYFNRESPDGTRLYFKLPSTWKTFGSTQAIEASNGKLTESQISQIENGEWLLFFAGTRRISLRQIGASGSRVPEGEVIARKLSPSERDTFSLAAMRSFMLGADPLTTAGMHVLSYAESTGSGGIRESRLVVDLGGAGSVVTTFGQVVAVDPQTDWVFAIGVGCRASCWGPSSGTITQILSSWTVKEQR
ncbi:MAG TPA: hypothetical protein VND23_09400 [Acidimicrobiales bacterium]|nr:hypothetical protein [Acidimicrobiales bacterium]